jgi:hypothetical protein
VESVEQFIGRVEVTVKTSERLVAVGLLAASVSEFLFPFTTNAELPDSENWVPGIGSNKVAELPAASEMLPPFRFKELTFG